MEVVDWRKNLADSSQALTKVTIGTHPSQLKRVLAVRMVDLAGYVICALSRPKGVLWDFDRCSEKASPVSEHPFPQTTFVQASMCEWSSYSA
ncbi:hypothetical protein TNCV_2128341 [Trichonephila clavipes]|nr:hypothetical protein TNCV_2128341 [Trichonephila clavipes]